MQIILIYRTHLSIPLGCCANSITTKEISSRNLNIKIKFFREIFILAQKLGIWYNFNVNTDVPLSEH
jgi:hypothetical protein